MTSDDYDPHVTGVGVYLKTVIPELIKLGHKVTLITSNSNLKTQTEYFHNLTIHRFASIKMFGFPQALLFSSKQIPQLTKEHFDIIHHHYLSLMMNTVFKTFKEKTPQLMTYHMTAEHISQTFLTKPFKSLIKKSYMNRLSEMDGVFVPSRNHLKDLQNNYHIPNLHFISNPNPLSAGLSAVDIASRKIANLKKNAPIQLLCVGRLAPEKNISFAIKTAYLIQQQGIRCELTIVGKGPEWSTLQDLNKRLNTGVNFVGFKDPKELKDFYLNADFFLLPSLFENQGLVLLEALSCGTPCMALKENISAPEMIEDQKTGFILPSSHEAWAKKIILLFQDKQIMQSLSSQAYISSQKYSLPEHIFNLHNLYQQQLYEK